MENEELKTAVLAKCGEAKTERDQCLSIEYRGEIWPLEYFHDSVEEYYQFGGRHYTIRYKFGEDTPAGAYVWELMGEILGIAGKPKRIHFVNIPADTRTVALAKPEPRPSDDLLWEAFENGRLSAQSTIKHAAAFFNDWLKTLTADPLEADRAALRNEFANGLERKLIDAYCTGDAIAAIKRLAGMEVGREQ